MRPWGLIAGCVNYLLGKLRNPVVKGLDVLVVDRLVIDG
jgi:hypothetical protein